VSAGNGSSPSPEPVVGQTILLRDAADCLRRWVIVAEHLDDGTVWVGLRPA
jgi:hypothetical protein